MARISPLRAPPSSFVSQVKSWFATSFPNAAGGADFDAAKMPLDRAVPVGLIVNELVTNSLRYAFDDEGGAIHIAFRLNQMIGEAELSVRDSGRRMGPTRPGSFGLRLVESLARQLGGRLTTGDVPKGTMRTVTFPYSL